MLASASTRSINWSIETADTNFRKANVKISVIHNQMELCMADVYTSESVTYGKIECDARFAVTFPTAERSHCVVAGTHFPTDPLRGGG